jgi:hypothetical protein
MVRVVAPRAKQAAGAEAREWWWCRRGGGKRVVSGEGARAAEVGWRALRTRRPTVAVARSKITDGRTHGRTPPCAIVVSVTEFSCMRGRSSGKTGPPFSTGQARRRAGGL